jgi:hypothetical protein
VSYMMHPSWQSLKESDERIDISLITELVFEMSDIITTIPGQ